MRSLPLLQEQPEALLCHRTTRRQGSGIRAIPPMGADVSHTAFRCLGQVIAIPPTGIFPNVDPLPQGIHSALPHTMYLFQIISRYIPKP